MASHTPSPPPVRIPLKTDIINVAIIELTNKSRNSRHRTCDGTKHGVRVCPQLRVLTKHGVRMLQILSRMQAHRARAGTREQTGIGAMQHVANWQTSFRIFKMEQGYSVISQVQAHQAWAYHRFSPRTPTNVPETAAEIVQQMDHSHQPTPAIPIARSITRAEYELDIFGSTLGSDTVMRNDESTDTVKNDGEDAPLAETTSMLSDDCICYYRRTPDAVGRCCCYRCSEDTPDPWWTYRWASQPHEETAADARGVSGCQLPAQDN
jgi:hypothetical protein